MLYLYRTASHVSERHVNINDYSGKFYNKKIGRYSIYDNKFRNIVFVMLLSLQLNIPLLHAPTCVRNINPLKWILLYQDIWKLTASTTNVIFNLQLIVWGLDFEFIKNKIEDLHLSIAPNAMLCLNRYCFCDCSALHLSNCMQKISLERAC